MSGVYVVTAIENDASVDSLSVEVFAGFESAKKRALELLSIFGYQLPMLVNPDREDFEDGEAQWVFVSTDNESVVITYRKIPDFSSTLIVSKYDPALNTLPGGFNHFGKPVTMETVINLPYSVKEMATLTFAQKWALTVARVRKSKDYLVKINNDYFNHSKALLALGNCYNSTTLSGEAIVYAECDRVENIRLEVIEQNA